MKENWISYACLVMAGIALIGLFVWTTQVGCTYPDGRSYVNPKWCSK